MSRKKHTLSRRKFIGQSCAAVGYTTLFSSLLNLKAIGAAAQQDANPCLFNNEDYQAMVCIVLGGGSDSFNMLIPDASTDSYSEYLAIRQGLAITDTSVTIQQDNFPNKSYHMHPQMAPLKPYFDSGDLAFVANVGSLVQETTKAQYKDGGVDVQLPKGLFSHSDQLQHWQTGRPEERAGIGWGGLMAELVNDQNSSAQFSAIPMGITLDGGNFWQKGNEITEFPINSSGAAKIQGFGGMGIGNEFTTLRDASMETMLDQNYMDIYLDTFKNTTKEAKILGEMFEDMIGTNPLGSYTPFPHVSSANDSYNNELAPKLKKIAESIFKSKCTGFKKQTYYVVWGGWDAHDNLETDLADRLQGLSLGMAELQRVLNAAGLGSNVTTFTISDFGRTLSGNGDGSDHGWGGNLMVMGGAVNGKKIYGQYPEFDLPSFDDINLDDRGRLLPTTSAAEYMAELAYWFGVPHSEIYNIFPNLVNFYDPFAVPVNGQYRPIGFMS